MRKTILSILIASLTVAGAAQAAAAVERHAKEGHHRMRSIEWPPGANESLTRPLTPQANGSEYGEAHGISAPAGR